MPWNQSTPTDEKIAFIGDYLEGFFSFSELCSRFNISRQSGYRVVINYFTQGVESLSPQSRRPHTCPHQTPPAVEEALVAIRTKHPRWGAKKLGELFRRRHPGQAIPARSTICDIIRRNGLVFKQRRRPPLVHPGRPITDPDKPNVLWAADYKGEFKTLDGNYCYPLTITDSCSRYILACKGLPRAIYPDTKKVFTRLFRTYGLPDRIRTDNGAPFASIALGRLSRLSIWWIRLGILPELIEPGQPQQNGKHERMHRTLKAETTRPPARNLSLQQLRFNDFVHEYNHERPHEALDMKTPSEIYNPSIREMPDKLPPLEYPGHFQVRRVSRNGGIRWKSRWVRVSQILGEEFIGLEEIDNGIHEVYFGPVYLGRFYEESFQIVPRKNNNSA